MAVTLTTYTVNPGETLSGIARKLGIGWVELAEANKDRIGNYNLSMAMDGRFNVIRAGDVLRVPGAAPQSIQWSDSPRPGTGAILTQPPEGTNWLVIGAIAAAAYFLILR